MTSNTDREYTMRDFDVIITSTEVVAAALPMQLHHWLPLSNLDLLLPPLDVGVFFCYEGKAETEPPAGEFGERVGSLKKALVNALVSFYAFAGEVVQNSAGEPELLCNNHGVEFVEARAPAVELRELDLYNPDRSMEGKFIPKKNHGVLCVQVTELKCGGIVVACTFDHRVADAYSANMFLVTWAALTASNPTAVISPTYRRSLLNASRPGSYDSSLNDIYIPFSSIPPPPSFSTTKPAMMVSRIYHLPASQLSLLQSLATSTLNPKPTKLQALSSFLWMLIAEHACTQEEVINGCNITDHKISRMGIVVDGRRKLNQQQSDTNTNSNMDSYFGNVLSIPFATMKTGEVRENSLADMAEVVADMLKEKATKEHFLGLIDWVEAHRPEPMVARVYVVGEEDGPAFVVSSGKGFPVKEVDFGWGTPVFGSYYFPWPGKCGYVMPMPGRYGGDWVVYMHLFKEQLDFIEKEACSVFKRFSLDLSSKE